MTQKTKQIGRGNYGSIYQSGQQGVLQKKFLQTDQQRRQKEKARFKKVSQWIGAIDPTRDYFTGLFIGQKQNQKDTIRMQKGGEQNLETILDDFHSSNKTIQSKRRMIINLARGLLNLMKGVQKLIENGYIHGDIKLPNIVWKQDTKQLRFIDYDLFGTVNEYTEASKNGFNFPGMEKTFIYYPWPLDHFDPKVYFKFRTEVLYPPYGFAEDGEILGFFFKMTGNLTLPLTEDVSKIDIYSIGLVFFQTLIYKNRFTYLISPSKTKVSQQSMNLKKKLYNLVKFMIHPNPTERKLPIEEYEDLLNYLDTIAPTQSQLQQRLTPTIPQPQSSSSSSCNLL